ncbi:hypothetical protein K435DRAFT_881109 [Dendrothele bispora CBS 962.96]|uniref:Uncharacterized protein n=1 Tax=Dendrothele bispora (strain CBS 962.96) TaxID=1314807 RepID=A0A4S8KIN1_DENBC|nr:hypothetical protein K435DRAFT_881109 [Dendrothele bispora CBS 962.96]
MIVVSFGASICSFYASDFKNALFGGHRGAFLANVWLSASSAADLCIAITLIVHFASASPLVLSVKYPEKNFATGVGFSHGRAYALTFLYNLNIRHRLQHDHNIIVDFEGIDVPHTHSIHVQPGSLQRMHHNEP